MIHSEAVVMNRTQETSECTHARLSITWNIILYCAYDKHSDDGLEECCGYFDVFFRGSKMTLEMILR